MEWYYVGLWPGIGYTLNTATVRAYSPEEAIAKAVKLGCGQLMSPDEYDDYLKWAGISEEDDDQYTYIDSCGVRGYVLLTNMVLRDAEPEDMLGITGIALDIGTSEGWDKLYFVTGEDLRTAFYNSLDDCMSCEVEDVVIEGETYPFHGTLEELMDELELTDADQIADKVRSDSIQARRRTWKRKG